MTPPTVACETSDKPNYMFFSNYKIALEQQCSTWGNNSILIIHHLKVAFGQNFDFLPTVLIQVQRVLQL